MRFQSLMKIENVLQEQISVIDPNPYWIVISYQWLFQFLAVCSGSGYFFLDLDPFSSPRINLRKN